MDGVLGIFGSVLATDSEYINIYLDAIDEHQSFRNEVSVNYFLLTTNLTKPSQFLTSEQCGYISSSRFAANQTQYTFTWHATNDSLCQTSSHRSAGAER